jgi:hypothetical protein
VVGQRRYVTGAVHVTEVQGINNVLHREPRIDGQVVVGETSARDVNGPVVVGGILVPKVLEQVGHLPHRRLPGYVVPEIDDAVPFADRSDADRALARLTLRHRDVGTVRAPGPAVERANHAVADHPAAVPQVRTEVSACCFDTVERARLGSVQDQFLPEDVEGLQFTRRHLVGPADDEPPGRCHPRGDNDFILVINYDNRLGHSPPLAL